MKIGDKVSVTDDNLNGTVTSVHGDKIVFVDEYGFTHKYSAKKLVIKNAELYENLKIQRKHEVSAPKSSKHAKNHFVLDLHFEKISKNSGNADSFERLFTQKEKLLETIEFCRKNKIKKLEIIRGIGDGTLQKMVTAVLESQTQLEFHHNAVLKNQSGSITVFFR